MMNDDTSSDESGFARYSFDRFEGNRRLVHRSERTLADSYKATISECDEPGEHVTEANVDQRATNWAFQSSHHECDQNLLRLQDIGQTVDRALDDGRFERPDELSNDAVDFDQGVWHLHALRCGVEVVRLRLPAVT